MKLKVSRRKEIIKIRAEGNGIETKNTTGKSVKLRASSLKKWTELKNLGIFLWSSGWDLVFQCRGCGVQCLVGELRFHISQSFQFSHSVMFNSLQTHGLQSTRLQSTCCKVPHAAGQLSLHTTLKISCASTKTWPRQMNNRFFFKEIFS